MSDIVVGVASKLANALGPETLHNIIIFLYANYSSYIFDYDFVQIMYNID